MNGLRFVVTDEPLDPSAVVALVSEEAGRAGGIASFIGLVRRENLDRVVHFLDYEAYAPLAVRTFERIAEEIERTWPGVGVAIHHRTGRVGVGEPSVAIAAGSAHRAEAFAACRYAIERVKQVAPIWKHEHFEGGEVWIEGATADPDDQQARALALERACG